MTPTLASRSPWNPAWLNAVHTSLRHALRSLQAPRLTSLHELDRRTLRDIGVDASEIASIDAEARGQAQLTRLRIVAELHHG